MSDSPELVVEIQSLNKIFHGKRNSSTAILSDVHLTVKDREFLIISGQSGSGKTTLLNIIAGLETPTSGSISIKGQALYDLSSDARARFRATRFGILYQQARWIRSLNVVQNVALPLITVGTSQKIAEIKAYETLEKLQLQQFAYQDPAELSGGEQQRVGIARAIIHDPWLIIADEPTGNLDTHNSDAVMSLFSLLNIREQRTVILVTHNPIYEFYGTHSIEIRDGKINKDVYNVN